MSIRSRSPNFDAPGWPGRGLSSAAGMVGPSAARTGLPGSHTRRHPRAHAHGGSGFFSPARGSGQSRTRPRPNRRFGASAPAPSGQARPARRGPRRGAAKSAVRACMGSDPLRPLEQLGGLERVTGQLSHGVRHFETRRGPAAEGQPRLARCRAQASCSARTASGGSSALKRSLAPSGSGSSPGGGSR